MADVSNPILNNPYDEPTQHYAIDDTGAMSATNVREGRRLFTNDVNPLPIKQGPQTTIFEVNDHAPTYQKLLVNILREEVGKWRALGYPNTTAVTRTLLFHWFGNPEDADPARQRNPRKLFFAQREAIETAIWLNEVAPTAANVGSYALTVLRQARETERLDAATPPLLRTAFRMATGSGKTVVMAALILYHYFNHTLGHTSDRRRYAGSFLLVAPGVTIRDRLGVLKVDTARTDRHTAVDYYRQRGLVPPLASYENELTGLNARIIITNYHSFEPRTLQGNKKSPLDGKMGADGKKKEVKESLALVVSRVVGKHLGRDRKKSVLVLNDEAHHCYLPLVGESKRKKSVAQEEEENTTEENARAAVWYRGIAEVARLYDVRGVYDLSATPYYLSGSGREPYSPFPWIVSSFDLVEAIESGLVKIPFMPEADDTLELNGPVLRDLYKHAKDKLPKMGAKKKRLTGDPDVPAVVKNALSQLYRHYEEDYARIGGLFNTPPVLIVVCNNTNVSEEVFRYVAGYERASEGDALHRYVPGHLPMFSNYDPQTRQPLDEPPTLLIDSYALESGEQVNEQFKEVFRTQIEKFRREVKLRGGDPDALTDADLLREVTNTVGQKGRLGEHVRCVVSVSMLTEGWDANTVTHIMGLRAFGSQLLCEQVAGRALRRMSYDLQSYDKNGLPTRDGRRMVIEKFAPEYAQIIGIPFRLFKGGKTPPPPLPSQYTVIEALDERAALEITFPVVTGYRVIEETEGPLVFDASKVPAPCVIGPNLPTKTTMGAGVTADTQYLSLDELREARPQRIHFALASIALRRYFAKDVDPPKGRFFEFVRIARQWYDECLEVKGDAFKQMVIYEDPDKLAAHIKTGIRPADPDRPARRVTVELDRTREGSTRYVQGRTTREPEKLFATERSHVNYVVPDTDLWEQQAAKVLEDMHAEGVVSYVKNAFLDFRIPYLRDGYDPRHYLPDFIVRVRPAGAADAEPVNLILEISGFNQDKAEKKDYTANYWVPAVNALDPGLGFGQWRFLECTDPGALKQQLRTFIKSL